jgi:aryl-alcohol dehydrogenase-like predicted oxidoreductase
MTAQQPVAGQRALAGKQVTPIGLGCMNVSWAYAAPPPTDVAARLLNHALDVGYDHLDTARLYGGGKNEALLGEVLKGRRKEFFLASKTGLFAEGDRRWLDCSPAAITASVEQSLKALQTDYIDLYYMHRRDFAVPIEDSAGAMGDLVKAGKIGGYGLSEMSAETLRRAHAAYPVAAVQTEYSLWTRNVEIAVLEATRELGIALVAFSPLGRGALANGLRDTASLEKGDLRRGHPRFNAENWPINLALVDGFNAVAVEQGVTPAQLSLAWVLSRGAHIHVIPGTTNADHLAENIARPDWQPDAATLARLDALINQRTVAGPRYPAAMQLTIDTEEFADQVSG